MGFGSLLGNERLKDNLTAALSRGQTSHFYLLSGPVGSGRHTLAKLLSASLQCEGTDKPCLTCSACRRVMAGNHPDVITVDDPEKKHVPIDLIRNMREDVFVRPNQGKKKIYIFPRGEDMQIPAQNALLKVLEEPPAYGVFLLLTDSPEKMLATVRSRCVQLPLSALPPGVLEGELGRRFPQASQEKLRGAIARSGGYLGQAVALMEQDMTLPPETERFLHAFGKKDTLSLVETLAPMEKYKRDKLIPLLEQWTLLLGQALVCRCGGETLWEQARTLAAERDPRDLREAVENLQKATEYARGNVSPAAICGWLSWSLRESPRTRPILPKE